MYGSRLKVKFKIIQKLQRSKGITQMTKLSMTTEPNTICLRHSGGGGIHKYEEPRNKNEMPKIYENKLFCTE